MIRIKICQGRRAIKFPCTLMGFKIQRILILVRITGAKKYLKNQLEQDVVVRTPAMRYGSDTGYGR